MVQIGGGMALFMFLGPLLVASEFLGILAEESYSESLDQAGAAGLLTIYGFMWFLTYLGRIQKNRKALAT